jgi:hypothetical protein
LHGIALANRLINRRWARRCSGWYHFNVLHHLSDLCFLEIVSGQIIWQPIYQGTRDWGDE